MRHFIVDTCTSRPVFGLACEGKLQRWAQMPAGLLSSRFLLPQAQDMLQQEGLEVQEIDLFACAIGPGSFTGMRVGAAFAKTLAYALQKPLLGFSSLEGLVPFHEGPFAAVIDAKAGGVYAQLGRQVEGRVAFEGQPALWSIAQAQEALKDVLQIVTPDKEALRRLLLPPERIQERSACGQHLAAYVHAQKKEAKDALHPLPLLYLRSSV